MTSFEKLEAAVKALDAKKGREIEAVRVDDLTVLADYFVIATATSSTHVRSLPFGRGAGSYRGKNHRLDFARLPRCGGQCL